MNILQIFNQYLHPGGEELAVDLIKQMGTRDVAFHELRFSSESWIRPKKMPAWEQALRMAYNPSSIRQLRQIQQETRSKVWILHNVFPVGSAGIFREARKLDVPTIHYIHNFRPFSVNGYLWVNDHIEPAGLKKRFGPEIMAGSWQNSVYKSFWYAMILKTLHKSGAYNNVTAWIAISDFMRDTFVSAGIPEDKIFTLHYPWQCDNSENSPVDNGYFLFLGALSSMKGIQVLLKTWALLENVMGKTTPKLIIGGTGPLEDHVKSAAARSDHVDYLGWVGGDKKMKLIRECTAMIAPSVWWEPLGLVTYEAYTECKPMLAARSGGLQETVIDKRTGRLHQPGDFEELASQVIELANSPSLCADMGQAGHAWLVEHTSEREWKQKFQKVTDFALSSH